MAADCGASTPRIACAPGCGRHKGLASLLSPPTRHPPGQRRSITEEGSALEGTRGGTSIGFGQAKRSTKPVLSSKINLINQSLSNSERSVCYRFATQFVTFNNNKSHYIVPTISVAGCQCRESNKANPIFKTPIKRRAAQLIERHTGRRGRQGRDTLLRLYWFSVLFSFELISAKRARGKRKKRGLKVMENHDPHDPLDRRGVAATSCLAAAICCARLKRAFA